MKTGTKPNRAILLLYEGETEEEFYRSIIELKIPVRTVRINQSNLRGNFNLTSKVSSRISGYLDHKSYKDIDSIEVIVAYDREGEKHEQAALDIAKLNKEFLGKDSRIKGIYEIVATQDLESWFFHDMEGIFKYLKTPIAERKPKSHPNVEKVNNIHLSALFHKNKKQYQKGKRCSGLIASLDLDLIINRVPELQYLIKIMKGS